jgi:hypothetical protein
LTDIITKFTYPRGTTYVSSAPSVGTITSDGKTWTVPGPLVVAGTIETIAITVEITDLEVFEATADHRVKGVTFRQPGEVETDNNTSYKLIE